MKKLAIAALLALGGYGIYRSRKPKKKKKTGPSLGTHPSEPVPATPHYQPPAPEPEPEPTLPKGELIIIDTLHQAQEVMPVIENKPYMMLGSVAPGSVRDAVLPAMQELAPQYPNLYVLFVNLSEVEQSAGGAPLRSNLAQALSGIATQSESGACVRIIGGPPGFMQELQANGETAVFPSTPFACVTADVRQMDNVVQELVNAAELASGLVPPEPGRTIRANPGRSILDLF